MTFEAAARLSNPERLDAPFRDPPARGELPAGAAAALAAEPFEIARPIGALSPVVLASPHSGRRYPADMLSATRLDPLTLRRSEDSFVEEIFADGPSYGAPLIHAHFPRAYVDANREPYELDPRMFADPLPSYVNWRTARVAGGLGTIARIVADGHEIYRRKLTFAEAQRRIQHCYAPYHAALRRLVADAKSRFGAAILIDCHSMPSIGGPLDQDSGRPRTDIVLGDRFGEACAPAIASLAEKILAGQGYRVLRNAPYAGGYTTAHYGKPAGGVHAIQIEINRALYMDEARIVKTAGIERLRADMAALVGAFSAIDPRAIARRRGARAMTGPKKGPRKARPKSREETPG